jgi:hypothetical protein
MTSPWTRSLRRYESAGILDAMTATFDHLDLRDLLGLLTEDEQEALRTVALQFVHTRDQAGTPPPARPVRDEVAQSRPRRLSFAGIGHAGPDVAEQSQEILRRELGGLSE